MSKIEPCTWTMGGVQLVTPTTDQLSAVNAIQAAITASANWRVVSTGTTASGKKYVEAAPLVTSAYKDMRVLFLQSATSNNGKSFYGADSTLVNKLCYMICPDGGASYCTFTPSRLEAGSAPYAPVYAGTKYAPGSTDAWASIDSPYTAFWLYECDGAMWLIHRLSASNHSLHGIGQVFNHPRTDWQDFNEQGTEIGLMGIYSTRGATTALFSSTTGLFSTSFGNRALVFFTRTNSTATATVRNAGNGVTPAVAWSVTNAAYEAALGTASFMPIACGGNTSIGGVVLRGFYVCASFQTRTTIKNATGTSNIGFSFYPDDSASGYAGCWMNTP
jgi:hypothetical protein